MTSDKGKTIILREVKQLRSDAKRLETVAKHLRQKAKDLTAGIRMEERAEKARTNFFSKKSKVDQDLPLTPDIPKEQNIFPEKG